MATVLALKINRDQAVLISDESTWHLGHVFGYRRTNFGDPVLPVSSENMTQATGLSAVYCGVGFPSMHQEVAERLSRRLEESQPSSNLEAAQIAHEVFLEGHRRLVDDKMRFDYGFCLSELNAREYQHQGKTRKIAQPSVIAQARAAAAGGARGNAFARIHSNQGYFLTRDREHGVQGWYLEPQGKHLGLVTPMDVLGDGSSLASHLMAEVLERRDLSQRRSGFETSEGLFYGLRIMAELEGRIGTMGGYLQMVFLDGEKPLAEVADDRARLSSEIARSQLWGFLAPEEARDLLRRLLLEKEAWDSVEADLFQAAKDQAPQLKRYLMGFKPSTTPRARLAEPKASK